MKRTIYVCIVSLILSWACRKSDQANDNFAVPVNQCKSFRAVSGTHEICLDSVLLDNRCAAGAACLVPGEAICRFLVKKGSNTQTVILSTNPGGGGGMVYPRENSLSGIRIRLNNLEPYPGARNPPYTEYKAVLSVASL